MKIRCACIHEQKSNFDFTLIFLNAIDWSYISLNQYINYVNDLEGEKEQNIDYKLVA